MLPDNQMLYYTVQGSVYIFHLVVHICSINQSLSLLAMFYGGPALFSFSHLMKLMFHVTPYRMLLHYHWLFVKEDYHLLNMINSHTAAQKLTCVWVEKIDSMVDREYKVDYQNCNSCDCHFLKVQLVWFLVRYIEGGL